MGFGRFHSCRGRMSVTLVVDFVVVSVRAILVGSLFSVSTPLPETGFDPGLQVPVLWTGTKERFAKVSVAAISRLLLRCRD